MEGRNRLLVGCCGPWKGAHAGVGLLAGPMTHTGPALFLRDCSLSEGSTSERFVRACVPWLGPHTWSRGRVCRGRSSREGSITNQSQPPFPILLRHSEDEVELGVKSSLERSRVVGGSWFRGFLLLAILPYY